MDWPRQVYGVDFSGAADAGRAIWIATGEAEAGRLRITACRRGEELPGSARERSCCLAALRAFIGGQAGAVFGLDFPFGLPRPLVAERSWPEFVLALAGRHASPEAFREECRRRAGGREWRRRTDGEMATPFSPYNLRLYRQTYYGICGLLAPLVREQQACVLPVQPPEPGKPWLLEICPASLLKREHLYVPYKGRSAGAAGARAEILAGLERRGALAVASPALRARLIQDAGGDALDSVLAALAAFRALGAPASLSPGDCADYALEGRVYA